MLNKNILLTKYNIFAEQQDKAKFISDVNFIRSHINLANMKNIPILVYNNGKRNALYYTLGIHFSLVKQQVLNFAVATGQTISDQHFLTEENRDNNLVNSLYYSDIAFISLSQLDYNNVYSESLIIDLIEFRKTRNTITIISYDISDSNKVSFTTLASKLHSYFSANQFQVIELTASSTTSQTEKATDKPAQTTKKSSSRIK
jgi:hypothetical protein